MTNQDLPDVTERHQPKSATGFVQISRPRVPECHPNISRASGGLSGASVPVGSAQIR